MRVLAGLAAMVAALLTAPAAFAATFVVNDPGAGTDAAALNACATALPGCTLPAAIQDSNTSAGDDTITFSGAGTAPGPFAAALPAVTDPVAIDGGGNTTVTFGAAATGTLLNLQAPNSTAKSIVLTGGGSGTVVNLGGSGDRLDTVTVRDAPGTGIGMTGGSVRVDGSQVQNTGGTGIVVSGSSATISSPEISGAGGDGISVSGSNVSISGGHIHGNSGNGVGIGGQADAVSHVVFFGNGGKPIATAAGANGGIAPPQNLRIGPRRPDGSLPLTGSTAPGTVELWSGNPSSASAPSFLDSFSSPGDFTYNFATEPAPGSVFAAEVLGGGSSSSEFATVAVPADIVSPNVAFARALDTNNVRVDFTEPLDPGSVQKEDFKLTMAGADRPIASAFASPDGRFVTLASAGWKAGEAGYVDLTSVGAVTDASGNAMLSAPRLRVAAAPGDFIAPLGGRLSVTPKTMCLTHGRGCRKTGMVIKFVTSEAGKARLLIKRSDVTVGTRLYGNIVPGLNALKFNGRLGARKLRAGRYRLLIYVQDAVGNITDQPPIVLFKVRRVTR
jgi:Right handed beta helix region